VEPAPSRTSQVVALIRAGLPRPHTRWGDPDAQTKLCSGMQPASTGGFAAQMAARTRFFDAEVLSAISSGIGQIVVLGAGYDDRALRFAAPDVQFYEVDHPATQADKAVRLETIEVGPGGPVLASADFAVDDLSAVLSACGHDRGEPSLFVCEGLLVYLDEDTIVRLLGALRDRAAGNSRMSASLAVHRPGLRSAQVTATANAKRFTAVGEPWRTILDPDAHIRLVERAGWRVERHVDAATLDDRVEPGRSLLVSARPSAR
jgi:methyltransferase (TIGR00027 family)